MSTSTIQEQSGLEQSGNVINQQTVVPVETTVEQENTSIRGGNRSFKVKLEAGGQLYGRYNGDSPYQAANKALSEIVRTREKNGQMDDNEITFFLVESTKNSSRKQHQYVGRRIKLDVPIEYPVANGITIKKEHKNYLRKVKRTVSFANVEQAAGSGSATSPTPTVTAGTAVVPVAAVTQQSEPVVLSSDSTTTGNTVSVSVSV